VLFFFFFSGLTRSSPSFFASSRLSFCLSAAVRFRALPRVCPLLRPSPPFPPRSDTSRFQDGRLATYSRLSPLFPFCKLPFSRDSTVVLGLLFYVAVGVMTVPSVLHSALELTIALVFRLVSHSSAAARFLDSHCLRRDARIPSFVGLYLARHTRPPSLPVSLKKPLGGLRPPSHEPAVISLVLSLAEPDVFLMESFIISPL